MQRLCSTSPRTSHLTEQEAQDQRAKDIGLGNVLGETEAEEEVPVGSITPATVRST